MQFFPSNDSIFVQKKYDVFVDGKIELNVELLYGDIRRSYPLQLENNKEVTTTSLLPRYLHSEGNYPITRIPKGTTLRVAVTYTDKYYRNGFLESEVEPKGRGVKLISASNNYLSLMLDKVDFTALKLQDLYHNRPTSEESINLNNLKFAFFTEKRDPYPILDYDDILLQVEFESVV